MPSPFGSFSNPTKYLHNTADQFVANGQNHYKFWQDSIAHIDVGTVVEVKTLGQTIRDPDLKQKLESETFISAEEIPLYACDVIGSMGTRYNNCQIMFPYVHNEPGLKGAGIYHVPEEGSQVAILASITGQPLILGFLNAVDSEESGFRNGKEPLAKGSIALKTSSENKIILRKGGIILVQSTPACLRRYIPTRDQIRDVCQNYFMTAEGGGIEWVKDPQTGVYTNWRHTFFDHPLNLPPPLVPIAPSAVIIDAGQDKDRDKQGRSIYNIVVQDGEEAQQFKLNIRPNGFLDIDSRDNLDPLLDQNRGPQPSVTGGIGTTGEVGCVDIDADHDIDITAADNIRIGSTPSAIHPRDYPARVNEDPIANFDGSPQQTTQFIHVGCTTDKYDNFGQDHIVDTGRNVQRVIGDKNDELVGGTAVHSVAGNWFQLGSVLHLNPSAQLSLGNITAGINSLGAAVFSGLAGATLFTADMNLIAEGYGVNHLATIGDIAAVLPFNVPVPLGESYTVGNVLGDQLGVVLNTVAPVASFPLVRGVDFFETDNGNISVDPAALLSSFGVTLATGDNFDFNVAEIDVFTNALANPDERPLPGLGDGGIPILTGLVGQYNQPSSPSGVSTLIRNAPPMRIEAKGPGNDLGTFGDPGGRTIEPITPVDV